MSEKSEESDNDDLILGLMTPRVFLQVAAMLPALTIMSSLVAPFLGISVGAAGLTLFFFLVLRALLDRRRLPSQVWAMAAVQLLATVYVFHLHGFEFLGQLGGG